MTWTMPSFGIAELLLGHASEGEAENRAAARVWLRPDAPAMGFDDGATDREADAHTIAFRGHKRLKQLLHHVGPDAAAGIRHADRDDTIAGAGRDDEVTCGGIL